ncbi:unnamed protein product [Didymodactylos carnosus]|uniref:F-box domain-containing protein n=1 Tax=Didymodactylos carnosus TaxID=1234261 RepID=A0A814Y706_9BILA|nr:unnamed protein product [Didymodactylos carnosus]CAF1225327.1 unnamed protein product [Didymodactylos carnosus]CAF3754152.1 unnamed protein product [Didymodactylos carnosus]CAF3988348.1 unnamed protein product [Didymodactylos carnosus]
MDLIFPNELFLDLFEYLSHIDLYRCFYGLNSRINSIVREHLTCISLFPSDLADNETSYCIQQMILKFCEQIIYLRLGSVSIPVEIFTNLQTLKLQYPYVRQLNQIHSTTFPYLKTLCVIGFNKRSVTQEYEQLYCRIFYGEFDSLLQLELPYIRSYLDHQISSKCLLEYLKIGRSSQRNVCLLIQNLVHLKTLSVGLDRDNKWTSRMDYNNPTLTRLDLKVFHNSMTFDEIEDLLTHVLNLTYFTFTSEYLQYSQFRSKLKDLLSKRLISGSIKFIFNVPQISEIQ